MRKIARLLSLATLILVLGTLAEAAQPKIDAQIQPNTASLGDRLTLTLTLRRDDQTSILQPVWELDPQQWAVLESLPAQAQPEPQGGMTVETFTYHVAFYNLEVTEFPTGILPYINAGGQQQMEIPAIPITIKNLVGEEEEPQLKPDRGTVDLSYPWWYWLLGALVLIAIIAAIYGLMRWSAGRYRIGETEEIENTLPPLAEALASFREIERQNYRSRSMVPFHYFRTTETVKRFIERSLGFFALEATTEEIALQIPEKLDDEELNSELLEFFRRGDFVKFAKMDPGKEDAEGLIDKAKKLVHRIHKEVEAKTEAEPETDGGSEAETPGEGA